MRQELFHALEQFLNPDDRFAMLPVYYAGGTASFTPTSEEVIQEYNSTSAGKSNCYSYLQNREDGRQWLYRNAAEGDVVLIMGARDNSLSSWAKEIVQKQKGAES